MKTIPKIIPNLRERLIEESRRQLLEGGYRNFTIRSVASGCKVATGTIYNYYSSKEMLVAHVILEDWLNTLAEMQRAAQTSDSFFAGIRGIHDGLEKFYRDYERTFQESTGAGFDDDNKSNRHLTLRSQFEEMLRTLCGRFDKNADEFLITFAAENLLISTTKRLSYDEMEKIFMKLF